MAHGIAYRWIHIRSKHKTAAARERDGLSDVTLGQPLNYTTRVGRDLSN